MGTGAFWAADSIATQITANANAARAANSMKRQQGYHCGDLAIQRAALNELRRLDPGNPLLIESVQDKIYDTAERELWRHGWARGSRYAADPHQVHAELLSEFEVKRSKLIQQVQDAPVKVKRRGWFFINRRDVFVLAGDEYESEAGAERARVAELARLQSTSLHDQSNPR